MAGQIVLTDVCHCTGRRFSRRFDRREPEDDTSVSEEFRIDFERAGWTREVNE
jgi:hypothetical protein